jgi:hypothetical protein
MLAARWRVSQPYPRETVAMARRMEKVVSLIRARTSRLVSDVRVDSDMSVEAEWAWFGDGRRGSPYGIGSSSSEQIDFIRIAEAYHPGIPRSRGSYDRTDVLPSVTFAPLHTPSNGTFVTILILDPSHQYDKARRPIYPERLFVIRYDELANYGATYWQLWHSVRDVSLPVEEKRPLQLRLVPQRIENVATAAVERYGLESISHLAALILEGRVAIAGSGALSRDERLAIVDAAIALLPYGCRAFLTTSTAVDDISEHRLDVVFAEFGQSDDQILVSLSKSSIPSPRTPTGRAYLAMLYEAIQGTDIETVIAYLRKATAPLQRVQRDSALEVLDELRQSIVKERAISLERATGFLYNRIEKFRKHIEPGRLMFNPPDCMQLWATERVEVRLTRALDLDAELLRNLRGSGKPRLEEIPTALLMAVFLKGDGFDITAYSDEEQIVTGKDVTTWEFDIRAIKRGLQHLVLGVSLRIPIADQLLKTKSVPVREAIINVQVRRTVLAVKFASANWQWFIGTAIAIAAVVVAILYH